MRRTNTTRKTNKSTLRTHHAAFTIIRHGKGNHGNGVESVPFAYFRPPMLSFKSLKGRLNQTRLASRNAINRLEAGTSTAAPPEKTAPSAPRHKSGNKPQHMPQPQNTMKTFG